MKPGDLHASIAQGADALSLRLSDESVRDLASLVLELDRWGQRFNLTAVRDPQHAVGTHLMDSLAVLPHLRGEAIADIGTGAGFPGLPLAIADASRRYVLLDANAKKLSFVRHIVGQLRLTNVQVVQSRAEDYAPGERFDTVIARALASTADLTKLGGHLVGEDGVLLALKGRRLGEELQDVPDGWHYSVAELAVPGLDGHARYVVALTRRGES